MPAPRYKQIVDLFASQIRNGYLLPGTQLPTHRSLAKREDIALVTASRVYAELESMGLVSGEAGRGTFVRDSSLPLGNGIDQPEALQGMTDLNFNSGSLPGQGEMLRHGLMQLSQRQELDSLLHYQPHAGPMGDRIHFAQHLKLRGLDANPAQLLITSGAQHALAITVMSLFNPGDVIITDALTYPGFKTVAELHRIELISLAVTDQGPDFTLLEQLCKHRKVRALYTMPTLHNPLGWVLSEPQRQTLISAARRHQLLLIEDAAYAFLETDAPAPIAQLAPDITIYINGLSKNIATGLRLGLIYSPPRYFAKLERTIRATTWNTPSLVTTLASQWLEAGVVNNLEAQKRSDAHARQQIARQVFQGMCYTSHPYAPFLWLQLPLEVRAETIASSLLERGISVSTAQPFSTAPQVPHALRVALSSVSIEQLEPALRCVRREIENYRY